MSASQEQSPARLLTIEEYLQQEEQSPFRHEYVGGRVYAFAGASVRHNIIALNIASSLRAAAQDESCTVMMSDVRLQAAIDRQYYPDVMVVCDPRDDDPLVKTRPCLLIEVLSPSTEATDQREKAVVYQQLESLESYLIVAQDRRSVLQYRRDGQGAWQLSEIAESGVVPISRPATELTLDEIYEGVDVEAE